MERKGRAEVRQENSGVPQRDRGSKRLIFRRTVFLMLLFGAAAFLPLFRQLWDIAILRHDEYSRLANLQQTKDVSVAAARGRILDRNGNVMAMSATVYKLILSPLDVLAKVDEKPFKQDGVLDQTAYDRAVEERRTLLMDGVCAVLESVSREKLENQMQRTYSQYEVVASGIEKEEADRLRGFLTEAGCGYDLWLTPDSKRYYPYGELASHVIGFVNSEGGAYGIEAALEDTLKGTPGRVVTTKTGGGTEMYHSYSEYVDAVNGHDVTLTIDATIQAYAEKRLQEGIKAFDVQYGGFCIVMDPNTGEILAMASSPDYDLNQYGTVQDEKLNAQIPQLTERYLAAYRADPAQADKTQEELAEMARAAAISQMLGTQWKSQAFQDLYEPGSTFKAMVLAAALEEGVVSESDTFYCPGYYVVNGERIHCSKRIGHGSQTLVEAVGNSCNPAFMQIGQRLGADRFYDYFEAFGLKEPTGIELAGEGKGQIWNREYLTSAEGYLSLATASFGQRFTVTPLQMVAGFAATINGGNLITPHLVRSVGSGGPPLETVSTQVARQVVSRQTSDRCREILEKVVSEGTGKNAYVAGYRIGGKTGTSETSVPGEVIVSFMGFAPADDPQIIVLLGYNVPKRASPGSTNSTTGYYISGGNMPTIKAGPLIAEILDYLGVEKVYGADEAALADTQTPQVTGQSPEDAIAALTKKGFLHRTVGSGGTVRYQVPAAGANIPGGSTVILYLGEEKPPATAQVPDVTGLSYNQAKEALEKAGFFMRASGASVYYSSSTRAQGQSLSPGQEAGLGAIVTVQFISPQIEDGL